MCAWEILLLELYEANATYIHGSLLPITLSITYAYCTVSFASLCLQLLRNASPVFSHPHLHACASLWQGNV
jgi:hypothetical protein